jgi:hypothetical protein
MDMFRRIGAAVCAAALLWASSAFAVQPIEITDVYVEEGVVLDGETDPTTLFTITGVNFDNGGAIELTLGIYPLRVLSQTDTVVEAALPLGMSSVEPGSYQVVATTGGGTVREDEFDGVTIGAVGPQGPKGDPGADGQDGVDGINGQDGSDGQDGANCYDGIGTSVADCIGPQGPAGEDGADGAPGTDGAPGVPGSPGLANLIATDSLVGVACDAFGNGGIRVRSGLDADRDGILSDGEVQAVEYVCNGADGAQGPPGQSDGFCAIQVDAAAETATITCPDGSSAEFAVLLSTPPIEDLLAVAYVNADGVNGYSSDDELIAMIRDTNGDGVVSVGDVITTYQFPLSHDGSPTVTFASPISASITQLGPTPDSSKFVSVLSGNYLFTFESSLTSDIERYREVVCTLNEFPVSFLVCESEFTGLVLKDSLLPGDQDFDRIAIRPGVPSGLPIAPLQDDLLKSSGGDDPFVDIDIYQDSSPPANQPPGIATASISVRDEGILGLRILATATGQDPDGNVVGMEIDFWEGASCDNILAGSGRVEFAPPITTTEFFGASAEGYVTGPAGLSATVQLYDSENLTSNTICVAPISEF